jgi:hypothetical protein
MAPFRKLHSLAVNSVMHRDIPGLCTGASHVAHVVSPDGSGFALLARQ